MADLELLVPTRGRPGNAQRLIDAMGVTCRADTHLTLGVDMDDERLDDYVALQRPGVTVVMRPGRHRLVDWLNYLATREAEPALIGHIGDDNVPRTEGWDERIVECLGERTFCFGNDLDPGRAPGSLSIHIFMRRWVVERLGYMGPPSITHMYVDPVWFAWGTATSMEYLDDVVLEHMHYSLGRSERDGSYSESTGMIPADCLAYNAYCDDGLNADLEKIGGRPFTPEGMMRFNAALNIPRQM